MLIIAGAEYLAGREYLQFANKLCDRKAAGKVTQLAFERAVTAVTPKKLGFLAYNYQDAQVRQLIQRLQGMLPPNTALQSLLADILTGAAVEGAETAKLGSYQVGEHVGILDCDGACINAGSKTVNEIPTPHIGRLPAGARA